MAYAPSTNPPIKICEGPMAAFNTTEAGATYVGGAIWLYKSADAIATVQGAGYFSDFGSRGGNVGDILFIVNTALPGAYLSLVTAVAAQVTGTNKGVATLTVTTTPTMN
jgi:hypothetical protein